MLFGLPLSRDKDLLINTTDSEPIRIVNHKTGNVTKFTKEEAEVLVDLLMRNGEQILKDIEQGRYPYSISPTRQE